MPFDYFNNARCWDVLVSLYPGLKNLVAYKPYYTFIEAMENTATYCFVNGIEENCNTRQLRKWLKKLYETGEAPKGVGFYSQGR